MIRALIIILCLWQTMAIAQPIQIQKINPPLWWVGMEHSDLELMVYGANISNAKVSVNYPGVLLSGVTQVENPNYLFVNLRIDNSVAQPGLVPILFTNGQNQLTVQYQLEAKGQDPNRIQGLSTSDLVYLIMPDRFANGDPSNDIVEGMEQVESSRTETYQRHGGDLKGIMDHLDYIEELGATALWLNPAEENNQPEESYHGYAATDHYLIDARLGTNQLYKQLVDELHKRDMKMVRDVVFNHVGDQHWFIKDLPSRDWVHQWPEFTKTTYRAPVHLDPYSSEFDRKIMMEGWFDTHMPDLNLDNPHLAKYFIQNSLWWIEWAGIDAYRIDTYAYPEQEFMADWAKAILKEYPQFALFGETWVHGTPIQSWFTEGIANKSFDSYLPGVTDFQLYYAINHALTNNFGWTEGVARIYYTLAKDYVYKDATKNVVFLDNHDLGRFASTINEDLDAYKMGIGFLLTTRGIPQVYYGTELMMPNSAKRERDDRYREEFSGGWEGDEENKFEASGRNKKEQEAFAYFQKLAQARKKSKALGEGKLMQFVPENGVYVYFCYHPEETVMMVMNQNKESQKVETTRFAERMIGYSSAVNLITDKVTKNLKTLNVPGRSIQILRLEK